MGARGWVAYAEHMLNGDGVSVGEDEKVLEMQVAMAAQQGECTGCYTSGRNG